MNRKCGGVLWATAMAVLGSEAAKANFIKCTTEHMSENRSEASTLSAAKGLSFNMKNVTPKDTDYIEFFYIANQTWTTFQEWKGVYEEDNCAPAINMNITSNCSFGGNYFNYFKQYRHIEDYIMNSINRITGKFSYESYTTFKKISTIQAYQNGPKEKDIWVVIRKKREGSCEPSEDMEKRAVKMRKF